MNNNALYTISFGFLFGVFVRSLVNVHFIWILFLCLIVISTISLSSISRRKVENILITILVLASFSLGILRFNVSDSNSSNDTLATNVGQKVNITAIIIDEPDVRENNTKLVVLPKSIGDNEVSTEEKILITIPKYPEFQYGDEIVLVGKLGQPSNFSTDSGKEFDYISYLAKDDIRFEMFMPKVTFVSNGHGNDIKALLFVIKNKFIEKINSVIPSPQSSLLGGLLVGAKASLGTELQDDFRKAGLVHIVVLSGYNVSIVAVAIMKSLVFLPRMVGVSFGAVSIVLFALMTGASTTTVRASIMALLVILTKITGRTYNITRALIIAGLFMVIQNPRILVFDLSFQLSFLATLALIYVSPLVEPHLGFITERFGLRGIVSATISTQIFVSPFILYSMGNFSIVALITNLLVLPFIPTTMFFGFIAGVVAFIGRAIALPFALIAKILLSYELSVVKVFSHLPFASLNVSYFPFWLMILIYIFYIWYIVKHSKKPA